MSDGIVMKIVLVMMVSIGLLFGGQAFADEAKQEGRYGAQISLEKSITVDQALTRYTSIKDQDVLLSGMVTKVCQQKGCWMALKAGNGLVRVTFKDYGFFVPDSLIGKKVLAQGRLFEKTMSISEARHYAQDAGASEAEIQRIDQPIKEYRFVATGVEERS